MITPASATGSYTGIERDPSPAADRFAPRERRRGGDPLRRRAAGPREGNKGRTDSLEEPRDKYRITMRTDGERFRGRAGTLRTAGPCTTPTIDRAERGRYEFSIGRFPGPRVSRSASNPPPDLISIIYVLSPGGK